MGRSCEGDGPLGRPAQAGTWRNFLDTFEKAAIEPERYIESGDSVVVPNTAYIRGRDGIETVARSTFVFEVRGD